jgi:hypothetical protein
MILMPLSASIMYYIEFGTSTTWSLYERVFYFSLFQWLWSVKNWLMGPLKTDSGLITWALVMVATHFRSDLWCGLTTALMSLSHGLVFLMILIGGYNKTSRRFQKSPDFCFVFHVYMLTATILWGYFSYEFFLRYRNLYKGDGVRFTFIS